MKIGIIILAAGKSSRMGSIKQLLPIKNTNLLSWVIQQAEASEAAEVAVVLGANHLEIKEKLNFTRSSVIINKDWSKGLSQSIVVGTRQFKDLDAILVVLGDQPDIKTKHINEIIAKQKANPESIIASKYTTNLGVPACFPKGYFKQLLSLEGDQGAKELLKALKSKCIPIVSNVLIDIDSPQDYKNYIKKG